MFQKIWRISASFALFALFACGLADRSFAQQSVFFTPGNLVVSVEGNGVVNGSGAYGDNQAAPFTLFQFAPNGVAGATFVNSLVFPQTGSGANLPVSSEYGSSSEGSLQLAGTGQYLTVMGYGINADTFNGNSNAYSAAPNAALAQSGSLTGQGYTPIPRVVALIDPYGNVNSSTALYNVFDGNNPRSAYTADGFHAYVSGQGTTGDTTGGVFLATLGATNTAPVSITGNDASNTVPYSSQDARTVQVYNNTLYVSVDSKEGSTNRDYLGTLGAVGTLPTGVANGNNGPTMLSGFGNNGGTGRVQLTAAETNGINTAGEYINLSPENYFFAAPNVLYVADSGSPKNTSAQNETTFSFAGAGGLQKWVNSKSNGTGTWTFEYTLSKGLNLVANSTANPNDLAGATGLLGLAGKVVGSTVYLYATNYNIGDLDPTYLYGITDPLSATANPGTSFTQLAAAPADSNFKGVSFAPSLPAGSSTITSSPSGLAVTTAGTGCAPGTYTTPVTLLWTPGSACTLSVATPQTFPGNQYLFSQWQDGSTATSDAVIASSTSAVYTATFEPLVTAWPTAATITYGQSLASAALTGGAATVPGTFAFTAPSTVPNAGTAAQSVTFTPANASLYAAVASTVPVTVNKAVLTVAPHPALPGTTTFSVGYGDSMPYLFDLYTLTGFVNGDTSAVVTGSPTATPSWGTNPNVGTYPLNLGVGTLSAANYTFTAVNGTVTVVPAVLTVDPQYKTIKYGEAIPALPYVVTGLKYGQTASVLSAAPVVTTTAGAQSGVGNYPISVNVSGITAANYTLAAGPNSTLTIDPATLNARANNIGSVLGAPLPALTYTVTGFVNGDTSSVLSGTAALTTPATPASSLGTYSIHFSTQSLSAANYTILYEDGYLTIRAR